jgi:hypothetical protein
VLSPDCERMVVAQSPGVRSLASLCGPRLRGKAICSEGEGPRRPGATEQDARRVQRWREKEFPEIQRLAKQAGARIFFGDQAGVRTDYHAGTTWGVRGQTPVAPRTGGRHSLNMLSVVNARGELRFMLVKGRVNGEVFAEFLRRGSTNFPGRIRSGSRFSMAHRPLTELAGATNWRSIPECSRILEPR